MRIVRDQPDPHRFPADRTLGDHEGRLGPAVLAAALLNPDTSGLTICFHANAKRTTGPGHQDTDTGNAQQSNPENEGEVLGSLIDLRV